MKNCPKCDQLHEKPGTFCSRKCANSRVWNEEDKKKKSIANKKYAIEQGMNSDLSAEFVSTKNCLNCGVDIVPLKKRSNGKYCSHSCQNKFQWENEKLPQYMEMADEGVPMFGNQVRRMITRTRPHICEICNITEWNNKPITLEVDHIDGDHGNNKLENLRLICPNCHSQTETYGGKNRGNGRKLRSNLL